MKIILTTEEAEGIFYSALCNAVGTGYMEGYGLELYCNNKHYSSARAKLNNPCIEDIWMQVLRDGNPLEFVDHEGEGANNASITLKDIHERMNNVPIEVLDNFNSEQDDASDADIVLQTVFYNEVIFG